MKHAAIWANIESKKGFVSSMEEGKQRVLKGNYAFFVEKHTATYNMAKDCRLDMVGNILPSGVSIPLTHFSLRL